VHMHSFPVLADPLTHMCRCTTLSRASTATCSGLFKHAAVLHPALHPVLVPCPSLSSSPVDWARPPASPHPRLLPPP
jgi:hypothetical protein